MTIVRQHIVSGDPVGSRTIAELGSFDVSSATVRNLMADLTREGYLAQPHTSAGRVPTEKAYRTYVDAVLQDLDRAEPAPVGVAFAEPVGEMDALLGRASEVLARLSNCVGLVLAPRFHTTRFLSLRFVRLEGRRVLAVIQAEHGVVRDRVVAVGEDYAQQELDRIANYLALRFEGRTLTEVREEVARELAAEKALHDCLEQRALALAERSFGAEVGAHAIYTDGTARCLSSPDFVDIETARALVEAVEAKDRIVRLLDQCIGTDTRLGVLIGSESPAADLHEFSLVAARYGEELGPTGTLGVLGPKRMAYEHVVTVVSHVAKRMTQALNETYPS